MTSERTRREVLGIGAGTLAAGALAGCLGVNDGSATGRSSSELTAQASFFVLGEFGSAVAGENATVSTLVPVGQHGHGWSPGPEVQRAVLESDAFIYMAEGFQPWADNIVQNISTDAPEIDVIEARAGIDLLPPPGEHNEGDDHGHESGGDPHFWLDPLRAKESVSNIANGLAAADSDTAGGYEENANAYKRRLDELDTEFNSTLEDRTTDTVLVAGHNAFQYLGHRYDFEVHALTGLSPDDSPTPQDVKRAQAVIVEHSIEYVLAPVIESDRAATQLADATDAAGVLPISALAGRIPEWEEKGWGYMEVMKNINLPSLERALGAN